MEAILQIRINLKHIRPPIWRRIEVPASLDLPRFHALIQLVMGWNDSHLHEFAWRAPARVHPETGRRLRGREREFVPVEVLDEIDGCEDEARVTVGELLLVPGSRLVYVYDHGDNWEHEIKLEKILATTEGVRYPRLVAGKRASPPEDCGGVPGYENLLETLEDPDDEEYSDLLAWAGEDFDPEAFPFAEVAGLVQLLGE